MAKIVALPTDNSPSVDDYVEMHDNYTGALKKVALAKLGDALAQTPVLTVNLSSTTTGSAPVYTTATNHGFSIGDEVAIVNSNGTCTLNGGSNVTVDSTFTILDTPALNTFTLNSPPNISVAPTTGVVIRPNTNDFSEIVNVKAYGATGDGVTDDTNAIQAALYRGQGFAGAGGRNVTPVYMPPGTYVITRPLWMTFGEGIDPTIGFQGAHLSGAGLSYAEIISTRIDATAILDRPALIIQRGRSCSIKNLQILGPNDAPNNLTRPTWDPTAYVTGGVRDQARSPQCAIALDPTINLSSTPLIGGDLYPSMKDWPMAVAGGSHGTYIENIDIQRHVVGVAISLAKAQNNDRLQIIDSEINKCKIAVAVGQSQSRDCNMNGCNVAYNWIVLDGLGYGEGQGDIPALQDCQSGLNFMLFSCGPAFSPGFILNHVYTENDAMLGQWGIGSVTSVSSMMINGGQFRYGLSAAYAPSAAPIFLEAHAPVIANGANFIISSTEDDTSIPIYCANEAVVTFNSCVFHGGDKDTVSAGNATKGISPHIYNTDFNLAAIYFNGCQAVTANGKQTIDSHIPEHFSLAANEKRLAFPKGTKFDVSLIHKAKKYEGYWDPSYLQETFNFNYSAVDIDGAAPGQITFDSTDWDELIPGDYLYWYIDPVGHSGVTQYNIPAMKVVSTQAGAPNVTCDPLFDIGLFQASYLSNLRYYIHPWATHPTLPITGNFTSGSATVSNVTNIDNLRIGDFLPSSLPHIPYRGRVASINVAGNSFDMNVNATYSVENSPCQMLYWEKKGSYNTLEHFGVQNNGVITLLEWMSGRFEITNAGNTAVRTINLPAAVAGMSFIFRRDNATYAFRVDPNAADRFADSTTGLYKSFDTNGAFMHIRCYVDGIWHVVAASGTITDE